MTQYNDNQKLCYQCKHCYVRWERLCSCESVFSNHYQHILHYMHPACKCFTQKIEEKKVD